ncbi:MAG: DUF4007 family protein [Acidobacteriota bacterium]|nr:DUF4007 family protein [Acidobacteriota bacterium]
MASSDLVGQTSSFSGHETFVFRYTWLKKGADAVSNDARVFSKDEAIVTMGVGKNMVRSIRHWALATGVLEEEPKSRGKDLKTSELGRLLFGGIDSQGLDPFLEDPNTLWLLHWSLMNNATRSTTWQWAFNRLPSNEFTREGLLQNLEDELRRLNLPLPSESTLKRDIEVFIRTYLSSRNSRSAAVEDSLDCPFTELGLIEEVSGTNLFNIRRGPKSTLGRRVFAFCLLDFWDRTSPDTKTLAFSEVAYSRNSPGNVFKLDENSLIEYLESLETATDGALGYVESAGLKQIYRQGSCNSLEWLATHYTETNPLFMVGS